MDTIFGFIVRAITPVLAILGLAHPQPTIALMPQDDLQQVVEQMPAAPADQGDRKVAPSHSNDQMVKESFADHAPAGIVAASDGTGKWQFTVVGTYSMQQDSYVLDLGDGTQEPLICHVFDGYECSQFKTVYHTYSSEGTFQVKVFANTRGLGNNTLNVVASTKVSTSDPPSVTAITVPGMTKYTDSDFGFSFWYPSSGEVKTITTAQNSERTYGAGTQILKTISAPEFTIDEVYSPSTQILGDVKDDPSPLSSYFYYFFDKDAHQWIEYTDGGPKGGPAGNIPANVSRNTMGGLYIFGGYTRFGIKEIIPLTAHNFLVLVAKCNDVTDYECGPMDTTPASGREKFEAAIQTIIATDPSVATPVCAAEQIKTIQAAKDAYIDQ